MNGIDHRSSEIYIRCNYTKNNAPLRKNIQHAHQKKLKRGWIASTKRKEKPLHRVNY